MDENWGSTPISGNLHIETVEAAAVAVKLRETREIGCKMMFG